MDNQALGTTDEAVAAPLGPVLLLASVAAIAVAALLVACLIAAGAFLIVVAVLGRDDASDLLHRVQFDLPLRTRLSAATISALYVGLAAATFGAAWITSQRRWRDVVAVRPVRWTRRPTLLIAAGTVAYAAAASIGLTHLNPRHVVADGPTDFVLIATIVANLGLLAPVAEELLFRGWIYTALRARWGIASSFVLTAALFAGIHWDANHRHILLVLPLAIALGTLRETTGSIKPTILLHAAYNLVIIAVTLVET